MTSEITNAEAEIMREAVIATFGDEDVQTDVGVIVVNDDGDYIIPATILLRRADYLVWRAECGLDD